MNVFCNNKRLWKNLTQESTFENWICLNFNFTVHYLLFYLCTYFQSHLSFKYFHIFEFLISETSLFYSMCIMIFPFYILTLVSFINYLEVLVGLTNTTIPPSQKACLEAGWPDFIPYFVIHTHCMTYFWL